MEITLLIIKKTPLYNNYAVKYTKNRSIEYSISISIIKDTLNKTERLAKLSIEWSYFWNRIEGYPVFVPENNTPYIVLQHFVSSELSKNIIKKLYLTYKLPTPEWLMQQFEKNKNYVNYVEELDPTTNTLDLITFYLPTQTLVGTLATRRYMQKEIGRLGISKKKVEVVKEQNEELIKIE